MKKIILIACLLNGLFGIAQNNLNLVPMPAQVKPGKGVFHMDKNTVLVLQGGGLEKISALLNDHIQQSLGFQLKVIKNYTGNNAVRLNYERLDNKIPGAYNLTINNKGIYIAGDNENGVFYGTQTLIQLFTAANKQQTINNKLTVPQVSISDYPRFPYRGMHLDVGRHFFPVSFIKKYIDYLATYKYNTFHWHLTEDQGWRIEIKKYPELTKTGAWRNGTIIGRYPGKGNNNEPYGGFYTQSEIKEVVQYAKERYIDVIPEIEMPGHSSAAIAAYPWLSCFPQKPTEIPAKMIAEKSIKEQKAGRIKLVQETWGVFDDVFCAGKDSTFTFLENVIDEVNTLFPSKYFHLGADECPKTHWKECPACQLRMKNEKLKDEHELQSWFVQRIEKYLNSKGKILIGWDEILEGGLAPNAVVMSWRGEAGGIEAAKQKHPVIMTPGNPVYFDHTQSKSEDSVTIGGYNPIENVYAYEPIPKELNKEQGQYVLGAQANMWTEYMNNTNKVEYMMFPRMIALSEVLWSPKEKRNWKDFERRLPTFLERLDKQKINYSKAYYDLKTSVFASKEKNDQLVWKLESKNTDQEITATYTGPLKIFMQQQGKGNIEIPVTHQGMYTAKMNVGANKEVILTQQFYLNKATGKKISLSTQPNKSYPGDGAFTLVNGVQNEKGLARSSEFIGFLGKDMEATIDLGMETEVSTITLHTLNQPGSWIYLPASIEVACIPFIDTTVITKHEPIESVTYVVKDEKNIQTIQLPAPKTCRYIRVYAKNYGVIPPGKPGAGNPAWLFADEIEVQ